MGLTIRKGNPPGIVIHHSLTKDGKVVDYDAIKRYHMEEKGWASIGYHWLIEQQGDKICTIEGRPANTIGAHCEGQNNMIGICVVGNYDAGHDVLDGEKFEALVVLVKNLMALYGLKSENVHRHHEYASKSCPGTGFPWVEFISRISK